MGRHLIVDGYNLARSGALLLSEDPAGPAGRDELCGLLSGYSREKGFRLTVVFDGGRTGAAERTRQAFKGGTALFSSRAETADDVIRALCRDAPSGTVVVTSDRGLAGTLSSREVAVVSCEEFAGRLADRLLAGLKGDGGGEDEGKRKGKKGEGRRPKKSERRRTRLLGKL